MQLPIRILRHFIRKPHRRLNIERGMNTQLNTELSALRHAQPSPIGMAKTLDAVRAIAPSVVSQPRRSLNKRLFPKLCCISAMMFVGTVYAYWSYIERDPVVPAHWWEGAVRQAPSILPTDGTLPSNAYDTYTIIGKQVDLTDIHKLPHFGKAGEWETNVIYGAENFDRISMSDSLKIHRTANAILRRNAHLMKIARTALAMNYDDTQRWEPYGTAKQRREFRKLWSLFMLEAYSAHNAKQYAQSARAAIDAIQLATQIQCNTSLVAKMIGMNWEVPARNFLWDALPHLDARELRHVVAQMNTIINLSQQTTVELALMNDWIQGNILIRKHFQQPNWRWEGGNIHATQETAPWLKARNFIQLCRFTKQQVVENFDRAMQEHIQWSRLSYSETHGEAKRGQTADVVSDTTVPAYGGVLFSDLVTRTQNRLLMAQASVLLYKQERGIYPASLNVLRPQQKPLENSIYRDLFTVRDGKAEPLRYIQKNDWYVLYSIGPDGKDNGARPITSAKLNKGNSYYYAVRDDVEGDIVAGVNRH